MGTFWSFGGTGPQVASLPQDYSDYLLHMFKKRTVKSQPTAKRILENDSLEEESPSVIVSQPVFKRRKPLTNSGKTELPTLAKDAPKAAQDEESLGSQTGQKKLDLEDRDHKEGSEKDGNEEVPVNVKPKAGPKAPPKSIRVVTLTDFQPDVCKDFQKTGYCGYGDTCKFLHIRDESVQKKPVEKEWETVAAKAPKKSRKKLETLV